MSQCKIYLENYSGTYYAGGEIRGRLECYFDDETTVRGIKIRLKCKEHNEWTGTETYTDSNHKTRTRHITLTGDHDVLYFEQMLFGAGSGSQVLNRGRYVYPFSFVLPEEIPSSFNGPHGRVYYKLKAVVDRPMRMDYEDNFNFNVVSPIDFNRASKDLQEPTAYSDEKTVCCWCCKGGDITMDVELPKLAYVPGEVINLRVTLSNLSNSNVDSLKVKLTKTVTYKVTSPHRKTKTDADHIIAINEHGVGAHGEHTYDLQLAIPEYIDVPNFTNCDLFNVSYELSVSSEMPACTLDMDINIYDIKMGHIQYTGYDSNKQQGITTPGFINNVPPMGGTYPPAQPYPAAGGDYPPPAGANYPHPPGGNYPPGGGYPALPDGTYPLPPGGNYPAPAGGSYPPPAGGSYPPPGSAGSTYPSTTYPSAGPQAYSSNSFEKPVYPGGQPSAPNSSTANAPIDDNPKAREAANSTPSVPYGHSSEPPPPSYNQVQQSAPYPPQ